MKRNSLVAQALINRKHIVRQVQQVLQVVLVGETELLQRKPLDLAPSRQCLGHHLVEEVVHSRLDQHQHLVKRGEEVVISHLHFRASSQKLMLLLMALLLKPLLVLQKLDLVNGHLLEGTAEINQIKNEIQRARVNEDAYNFQIF